MTNTYHVILTSTNTEYDITIDKATYEKLIATGTIKPIN